MDKFYLHSLPQPFHISVGAVLFNDKYEVCIHHFFRKNQPENLRFLMDNLDETYHLMRESLEGDESLQAAVLRGVQEEFGAIGIVEKYLGPKIDKIITPDKEFEKLTLYHAVRLQELGERPQIDEESKTKLEWHSPNKILEIYNDQVTKTQRPELDERIIIERFIDAYGIK